VADLLGRREKFARLIADGAAGVDAYLGAGYKPNDRRSATTAASRLLADPDVRARVGELQAEHLQHLREKQEAAAEAAGIDLAWLQKSGKQLFKAAMEKEDFIAASQTLERIAKFSGFWVDRSGGDSNQVLRIYSETPLSEEEWERLYCRDAPKEEPPVQ
jgi:hypothetical protein